MNQHTPGPWKVDVWDYPLANPPRKELKIQSGSNLLATLQCDYTGANPYTIPQVEAEANASLIVAAPDLMDAVRELLGDLDDYEQFKNTDENPVASATLCRARQALAKAEWRS